jgi:hypothetical protein
MCSSCRADGGRSDRWSPTLTGRSRKLKRPATLRRIQLALGVQDNHVTVDSRHNPDQVREMCLRYGQPAPMPGLPPNHVGWIPWEGQKGDWRQIEDRTGSAVPLGLSRYGVPLTWQIGYNLHAFQFAGDFFLSLLSRLRKGPDNAAGLRWELVELPCGPEVPGAVRVDEETYRRHLDAKRYEPRAVRRRVVWEWVKRSSRWPDHLLYCEVTQIAWAAFHDRLPLNLPEEAMPE